MSLKKKVQELMNQRKEANKAHIEKIAAWEADKIYSAEYKQEQIAVLKAKITENDAAFNEKLKGIIAAEKEAVLGKQLDKPADYQAQIANALEFIKLAGKSITDDQAAGILEPFQNDVRTMDLFQAAIAGSGVGDIYKRFTKTFEKTNAMLALSNNFVTVEELSGNLFNSDTGLQAAISTEMFMGNIDSIDKLNEKVGA
jgi:hypothetical protein